MKYKITPYLVFTSGVLFGVLMTSLGYNKVVVPLREELEKVNTVSKLILDTDRWLWETIDNTDDVELWAQELKDRLSYIEMIIALYSVEE